jgi:hypothetical protein
VTDSLFAFDSGVLPPGSAFTYRFSEVGFFTILDTSNTSLNILVEITDATTTSPSLGSDCTDFVLSWGYVRNGMLLVVQSGQTIRFVLDSDSDDHTITAADGSFDSGVLQPGDSYDVEFLGGGRSLVLLDTLNVASLTFLVNIVDPDATTIPTTTTTTTTTLTTTSTRSTLRVVQWPTVDVIEVTLGDTILFNVTDVGPVVVFSDDTTYPTDSGNLTLGDTFSVQFKRLTSGPVMFIDDLVGGVLTVTILPPPPIVVQWPTVDSIEVFIGSTLVFNVTDVGPVVVFSDDTTYPTDSGNLTLGDTFSVTFNTLTSGPVLFIDDLVGGILTVNILPAPPIVVQWPDVQVIEVDIGDTILFNVTHVGPVVVFSDDTTYPTDSGNLTLGDTFFVTFNTLTSGPVMFIDDLVGGVLTVTIRSARRRSVEQQQLHESTRTSFTTPLSLIVMATLSVLVTLMFALRKWHSPMQPTKQVFFS